MRQLAKHAASRVTTGRSSGECAPGHGCRAAIDEHERFRRDWLLVAGVTENEIRAAGGSRPYVLEFGLPEMLWALAGVMPADAPAIDQRRKTAA